MKSNYTRKNRFIGLLIILSSCAISISAQSRLAQERKLVESSGDRFWYTMVFLGAVLLGAAYYIWRKTRKVSHEPDLSYANRGSGHSGNETYEIADGDKELEWLRKAKKPSTNSRRN